jgi:YgiT-type zinc finger domain-containing protein
MKCAFCKAGTTNPGSATYTVERDGHTYVLRDVPGEVCGDCGEAYFSGATVTAVMTQVELANTAGTDVAVLKFKAAS